MLFHGEPDLGDGYKFTPLEVQKVVERERSRIELMAGNFIYSGYNLWTPQKLDESLIITSKLMGQKVTLKIDHEGEYTVNTADIQNPDRESNIANQ